MFFRRVLHRESQIEYDVEARSQSIGYRMYRPATPILPVHLQHLLDANPGMDN